MGRPAAKVTAWQGTKARVRLLEMKSRSDVTAWQGTRARVRLLEMKSRSNVTARQGTRARVRLLEMKSRSNVTARLGTRARVRLLQLHNTSPKPGRRLSSASMATWARYFIITISCNLLNFVIGLQLVPSLTVKSSRKKITPKILRVHQ